MLVRAKEDVDRAEWEGATPSYDAAHLRPRDVLCVLVRGKADRRHHHHHAATITTPATPVSTRRGRRAAAPARADVEQAEHGRQQRTLFSFSVEKKNSQFTLVIAHAPVHSINRRAD